MRRWIILFLVVVLCYTAIGCIAMVFTDNFDMGLADKIRVQMGRLADSSGGGYGSEIEGYFGYYGLDAEAGRSGVRHFFGTFDSGGFELAGHIYEPTEYKATAVLLHGYMNHAGQMRYLIEYLLDEGYAVAVFDMPGHGLSTGELGAIDDFSQYTTIAQDFTAIVQGRLNGPWHLIAFSAGAVAAMDWLMSEDDFVFDKAVLGAPLIHHSGWNQAKVSYWAHKFYAKTVPRVVRNNSSDKEFLKFNRGGDFLHLDIVSLKWVVALRNWNKRADKVQVCPKPVLVLQGVKDKTVDWQYNLKFLRSKFTNAQVTMIEGARHELFNESAELRDQVFSRIGRYLEEQ